MRSKINVILASTAALLLMTACTGMPPIEGTAAHICGTWKPVFISKHDSLTTDTAKQIAGNNTANRTWCGDSPPPVRTTTS